MTPRSPSSCGWRCPTHWSRCATISLAAAITVSPVVECLLIRPVRADITASTGIATHTITASRAEAALLEVVRRSSEDAIAGEVFQAAVDLDRDDAVAG